MLQEQTSTNGCENHFKNICFKADDLLKSENRWLEAERRKSNKNIVMYDGAVLASYTCGLLMKKHHRVKNRNILRMTLRILITEKTSSF